MGSATEDRAEAAQLPEGDVIRVLLEQHARIRDLFAEVGRATGEEKQRLFDELRALLAVHETAEEMVLRPVTTAAVSRLVAHERNHEEAEANIVLQKLEKMTTGDPAFDAELAAFEKAVDQHAEAEEHEEFPLILEKCDEEKRRSMGRMVLAAEKVAPTHPHPTAAGSPAAQWTLGPFAALVDRAKDAIKAVM